MAVPVGLNIWSRLVEDTFPYFDQTVAPFDILWMPDHVQYGAHKVAEGWTLLTWALARYPDKRCGHEVLCNSFRNPAHLAKMAATAQALSGGRFILGIGAGWNAEEYAAYGWPYPPARVRIAQLAEAIELIRRMWAGGPAEYHGEHYAIADAHCEPRPDPVPPVMVGGSGEKYLLRVVARHADWWNYVWKGPEAYAHKQEVLKGHCRDVGRDYDAIEQVVRVGILIAESEREVERLKRAPGIRSLDDIQIVGTPAQVTEIMRGIVKQGARRLTVNFADVPRPEGTWLFASTVLPHLYLVARTGTRPCLYSVVPSPVVPTDGAPPRLINAGISAICWLSLPAQRLHLRSVMTIHSALGWLRERIGRPAVFFPVVTGVAVLSVYGFIEGGLAMTDRLEGDLMRRMAYYRDQEPTVLVTRYEERLRTVRAALMKRGYNADPTDTAMGPRTAEALRSFQRRQGLHVTGRPDSATAAALGLER